VVRKDDGAGESETIAMVEVCDFKRNGDGKENELAPKQKFTFSA
jgi:hypothetical protein